MRNNIRNKATISEDSYVIVLCYCGRGGGAGEPGSGVSNLRHVFRALGLADILTCNHILLLAASGLSGESHADGAGLHERLQVTPEGVLPRANIQMLNDFSACARGAAEGQKFLFDDRGCLPAACRG